MKLRYLNMIGPFYLEIENLSNLIILAGFTLLVEEATDWITAFSSSLISF